MTKEKFDFEDYSKFCKENKLEVGDAESISAYKVDKEQKDAKSNNEQKIAEQKEIFDLIAKHCGRKVKYDENFYDCIERVFKGMLFATEMCSIETKRNDILEEYDMKEI